VGAWRPRGLQLLRQAVGTTPFIHCSDFCSHETEDRTKEHATDDVATQYLDAL
jgi:hypothetical protein